MFRSLLLLGLLFPFAAQAQPAPDNGPKKPLGVYVTEVRKSEFADQLEALGTLRANESIVLTATITDTVTAVNFDDGARVEKGDILLELTSNEESALLDEEQSTVNESLKQVERLKPLVAQGAAAQSLLDERRREYETSKARLEAVKSRLQDRIITAPFAGVVGMRNISVGALVQPGMQITTLDDDSVMKLDFAVPSLFLSVLKPGLPIIARTRALEGRDFKGQIYSIGSQVDPVTSSVMVRALIPNEDRVLKPGLLMNIHLFKGQREALIIPEETLIQQGSDTFVFRVEPGEGQQTVAKQIHVTVGARRPGEVEILEGLELGDVIITDGTLKAKDGAAVTVVDNVIKKTDVTAGTR